MLVKAVVEAEAGMREVEEGTYLIFLCGHADLFVGIQYWALIAFWFLLTLPPRKAATVSISSICKLLILSSEDQFALV